MKKPVAFVLCLLFLSIVVRAQDSAALQRPAFKLKLAVDRNTTYEANIEPTPYLVHENILQIYPGEQVYLEVTDTDGKISRLRAVREIADSAKTLIVGLSQLSTGDVHSSMMLKVVNPFPYDLTYSARMLVLQKRWVPTDVLPVKAYLTGYETWPNVIISLALADWKFEAK